LGASRPSCFECGLSNCRAVAAWLGARRARLIARLLGQLVIRCAGQRCTTGAPSNLVRAAMTCANSEPERPLRLRKLCRRDPRRRCNARADLSTSSAHVSPSARCGIERVERMLQRLRPCTPYQHRLIRTIAIHKASSLARSGDPASALCCPDVQSRLAIAETIILAVTCVYRR